MGLNRLVATWLLVFREVESNGLVKLTTLETSLLKMWGKDKVLRMEGKPDKPGILRIRRR